MARRRRTWTPTQAVRPVKRRSRSRTRFRFALFRPRRGTTWTPAEAVGTASRTKRGGKRPRLSIFRSRRGTTWGAAQAAKVAKRKRRRLKDLRLPIPADVAFALGGAILLGGLSFLYIHQGTMLRALTADREVLREDLTELEEINHTLRLEIAEAFSLPRISKYATERLGMIEPPTTRYVRVPPTNEK